MHIPLSAIIKKQVLCLHLHYTSKDSSFYFLRLMSYNSESFQFLIKIFKTGELCQSGIPWGCKLVCWAADSMLCADTLLGICAVLVLFTLAKILGTSPAGTLLVAVVDKTSGFAVELALKSTCISRKQMNQHAEVMMDRE